MNYEDKDYIDGSAPDGFDTEECPHYKEAMSKLNQDKMRDDLKRILEHDNDRHKINLVNTI